jgi:excisionase family DNA binding protein
MEYLERGWDDTRIAAKLGCSATAVSLARKRAGIPCVTKTLRCPQQIAALLGLGCPKTVVRWIQAGWLRGRRGPRRGGNRQWIVTDDAFHAFLADPAHWHRWEVARITDPTLRAFVASVRSPDRYLTLTEVAELCCVQPGTVWHWIDKGWLPAVRNGNHRVREADALRFRAARLAGQVHP